MVKMQNTKAKNLNDPTKNPLESLRDLGTSSARNTANTFGKIGGGMLDQFFNESADREDDNIDSEFSFKSELDKSKTKKKEVKLFNYQEYYESTLIKKQIQELTEAIKKEIEMIKKSDSSLLNEIRDVEKLTINDLPEKPGIYHIRFLELVLNILRTLRAKVGESKTWLQALMAKKKKRGSAFVVRSKKQGTQYSMSQELSNSRSVQ
jgi:tRNA(Ser,Leu) C12 N-acetylase TAN1